MRIPALLQGKNLCAKCKVQILCRIRDSIIYLGPGVKHRDDKFLSSFYSEIVFMFVVCLRKERKVCHPGA